MLDAIGFRGRVENPSNDNEKTGKKMNEKFLMVFRLK